MRRPPSRRRRSRMWHLLSPNTPDLWRIGINSNVTEVVRGCQARIRHNFEHGISYLNGDASLAIAHPPNGDWVSWYVAFAQSPLVIGYSPSSRFAAELQSKPWYEVMQEPGVRIGRTDPKLDPKGALTVQLLAQAEQVYKLPGLATPAGPG